MALNQKTLKGKYLQNVRENGSLLVKRLTIEPSADIYLTLKIKFSGRQIGSMTTKATAGTTQTL